MLTAITGTIFDIRRYSVHDGPGIRTTVFFKGCPLRCTWCHNPESQRRQPELIFRPDRCIRCGNCLKACKPGAISWDGDPADPATRSTIEAALCDLCAACANACPSEARQMAGRQATVQEVMEEVVKDVSFYDESGGGVTFSGGEPLLQPRFLQALLQACRSQEIRTALDTSGFASWAALNRLRDQVDLFLYDLKLVDEARHRQFTGVGNRAILSNLRRLSELGHAIIVRLPIIPGITDDVANIRQVGSFVASLPHIERLDILPYHHAAAAKYERLGRAYSLHDLKPPSQSHMEEVAAQLSEFKLTIKVGG